MSNEMDRRMKELMGRMVDMAPEAPPFPEEMVTVVPAKAKRSMRPTLVFATAAVVVLLVALPLLLFQGDGGVDPAVTTVPAPVPTTTVPETGTTAVPELQVTMPVMVYLTQEPENSLQGNPALVPVRVLGSAPEGAPEVLAALRALVGPSLVPPPGLGSSIPEGMRVFGVTMEDETVVVDMDPRFLEGAGGFLADVTMLNQLIWTAAQGSPDVGVRFTVNGAEPGPYGSEGLLLDTVFLRDYFLDQANNVLVTTPIGPESTEVSGIANVFEATVAYEIRDSGSEVVEGGFTMVACGTGCWGSFTIDLDPDLLEPGGQVRLFWNSPEDGEPTNVVVVPIPEDAQGIWDLITP